MPFLCRYCVYVSRFDPFFSPLFHFSLPLRVLHSFPTRRSSDLRQPPPPSPVPQSSLSSLPLFLCSSFSPVVPPPSAKSLDRKSTRLNSSHVSISYAVFCLKKKKST